MPQQVNVRLPQLTRSQIDDLCNTYGLTKTQVIILSVDRLARALGDADNDAYRNLRRLRTVARILPDQDLGQED